MRIRFLAPGYWLLASVSCLLASVDGVVTNGTTGKPQGSVIVSLVQPSQSGMQTLGSVKTDAEGKFKIDKEYSPGPVLIQALFSGATYTKVIPPGSPTSGVAVQVFDSTTKPEVGQAAEHMILIEPSRSSVQISETFLFSNQTQLTFADPVKGSAQFFLPKAAEGKAQVIVNAPGGMPIPREPEKTNQAGVYKVAYPVKPGETRFDISYSLPATRDFAGKKPDPSVLLRLVTPSTVTLTGEGIDSLGQEPQTQAHIYNVRTNAFNVTIEGEGSLRNPGKAATPEEDTGQPQITSGEARIYSRFGVVIGLTLAILGLGGVMLYRKGVA